MNTEIEKKYKMYADDWQPLVDAMKHLSNVPCCGDVAKQLHQMFVAAEEGKYYFIEIGYEGQDGKCFVTGQSFRVPNYCCPTPTCTSSNTPPYIGERTCGNCGKRCEGCEGMVK